MNKEETKMSRNTGQTALITGATSGIGYELARVFAHHGHGLVIVARDTGRLNEVKKEIEGAFQVPVGIIAADLSRPQSASEIFAVLQKQGLTVDVLVNNAGFNEYGLFTDTNLEKETQMIQTNITSLTQLTKLILPAMVQRGRGRVMNVGSTGSFVPVPKNAVYAATKAYVLSFSDAIGEELKGTGVTVTTLCPGATETRFAERAGMGDVKLFQGGVMKPAAVARVGYRALMCGKKRVVAGCANKLMVFSMRFVPRCLVLKVGMKIMEKA
jgi:short-subunit dehydrogenase